MALLHGAGTCWRSGTGAVITLRDGETQPMLITPAVLAPTGVTPEWDPVGPTWAADGTGAALANGIVLTYTHSHRAKPKAKLSPVAS